MKTYGTISGIPIKGYCRVKDTDIFLPMIETDTDIQWVEGCIKDREEHPEKYPDEDVPAVIARQKILLEELRQKEKEKITGGTTTVRDRFPPRKQILIEIDGGDRP